MYVSINLCLFPRRFLYMLSFPLVYALVCCFVESFYPIPFRSFIFHSIPFQPISFQSNPFHRLSDHSSSSINVFVRSSIRSFVCSFVRSLVCATRPSIHPSRGPGAHGLCVGPPGAYLELPTRAPYLELPMGVAAQLTKHRLQAIGSLRQKAPKPVAAAAKSKAKKKHEAAEKPNKRIRK